MTAPGDSPLPHPPASSDAPPHHPPASRDAPLRDLLQGALHGAPAPLEAALAGDSRLPGPRANLELAHRFADAVRDEVDAHPAQREAALALLAAWLAHPPRLAAEVAPDQLEFLPAVAALAAGALGDVGLLTTGARDERWRVRELAATGMQRVLAADWRAGLAAVDEWVDGGDPLEIRAAVAAVAEPPLLADAAHAAQAVVVVERAADELLAMPRDRRREPDVRTLRQALGYAVSVVTAAHPDGGVPVLERLATSADPDARWIARENFTKARLTPLADRLAVARAAVERP